jgi:hypothetical protein
MLAAIRSGISDYAPGTGAEEKSGVAQCKPRTPQRGAKRTVRVEEGIEGSMTVTTTRSNPPKKRQRVVTRREVPLEQSKFFQMSSPRGQAQLMRHAAEARRKK